MEREGERLDSPPLSSNPPLQSVAAVEVDDGFEGGGGGGSGGGVALPAGRWIQTSKVFA
uniref:Uncharacterized protein n=1 Tax=Nelumbo nucifera TaxID=4432 RepID=A0A822YGE4_NELNU|nr:TPA_asm: hypothetical protein HUJ06_010353 [Nelumbo nucifera]